MRWAAVCTDYGGPDSVIAQRVPRQTVATGELRIRIQACGLNFPDLLMTRGQYQLKIAPPFIPGMEAAGVIEDIGPGASGFKSGDRVVTNLPYGLFASEAVVPAANVSAAPAAFTMPECACYRVAAMTAWHALGDRAQLRAGESVLVLGAGSGVGLGAVEMAALMGAEVIAAASSTEKLAAAQSRGAKFAINYMTGDLVDQVRAIKPHGVDVIFDPVGGDLFDQALRLPAANGRLLVIGFASGRIGAAPANLPLIKGYSIVGVRAGEAMRRDPQLAARLSMQLANWTTHGHLRPLVSRTYALADAATALKAMDQRSAVGRIALVPPESPA
jgi:NADPH2:quinone reductase